MTVFPLAKPLGGGEDPAAPLLAYTGHRRPPPDGALKDGDKGASAEPYWRFVQKSLDHSGSARATPSQEAAWRIHERAEAICRADPWKESAALRPGDALLFRSADAAGTVDHRAIHASCTNTGPKMVLSKFMHRFPLSDEERYSY